MTTIHLALVDDWELSGNGSGDLRQLQFEPMRRLVSIYNRLGIRGSFNAEVMQQIAFRRCQSEHPELRTLADEWDNIVRETFRQGHDIQLHVHPQWQGAEYKDGGWKLTADWSILNYPRETALHLLRSGKEYLESLLKDIDPDYRCVSFRSGAWCIAPSPHMLDLLVDLGIVFDMSIVAGVKYDTRNIKLDYTDCEEGFLPYYPVMTDARRVSDKVESIICVPTNCFYASRRQVLQHHLDKALSKIRSKIAGPVTVNNNGRSVEVYGEEWAQIDGSLTRIYRKGIAPYIKGKHTISDLAQLDYPLMMEMLGSIRKRARASGLTDVPVVLENHTKDLQNFSDLERFLEKAVESSDVKFITLTELATNLKTKFKIKIRSLIEHAATNNR
ncbi:MAG TPA: hypothetical protein VFZ22_06445 [Pyrinomonadaceae bacterium]|nr:hypothetical protein [Pyrinomonadaceae bacterium]